jgi:uncharacterized protein YggE
MKLFPLAAVAATAVAIVLFVSLGRPGTAHSASPHADTITVSGVGDATVAPNQASFDFAVTTTGGTAHEALAANAAKMNDVIYTLEKHGVRRADIQTQDVSSYSRAPDASGFGARDEVGVTVRALARAGTIVDAAVGSGADEVSGPTFSRSDKDALYRAALRDAVANARAKAESLAEASHVGLGGVTKVEEQTANEGYPVFAAALAEHAPSTPIAKGTQKTEATVNVTFAIGS